MSRISGIENMTLSLPNPRSALTDVHQTLFVAVDQRAQEDGPYQAEDCGVRADPPARA
jgi:hypothetical protein